MSTIGLLTINHPDDTTVSWFIENTIRPLLHDINSDLPDGWSLEVASGWHTLPFDSPEVIEKRNRDKALRTALSLALSEFPESWTNEQVLEGIHEDNELVVVWEPFENWSKDDIAEHIEVTANSIYSTYH